MALRPFAMDGGPDDITSLALRLSTTAKIFVRGGSGWEDATRRWTEWCRPDLDLAVEVATEDDVAMTVRWANEVNRPFLAISGTHGGTMGLRGVRRGVGILMRRLNRVRLTSSGDTAVVCGGCISGKFLSELWTMGKMTVTGCCKTTGVVAPMLGGGHGFLQGQYGLMADQLVSAKLITATGDIVTVSDKENSDLFWGLRGAGHNFGIVTEFEYKVYNRTLQNETWSHEMFVFDGEQLETIYEAANRLIGAHMPVELLHFGLMANNPTVDERKPIILFFLLYQGPAVPSQYSSSLNALSPLSHMKGITPFIDLPAVLGFSADGTACLPGKTWLRFPASTTTYNISALRKAYDIFASFPDNLAKHSSVITEAYSTQGVQAVAAESTAVPDRGNHLLLAAFVVYEPRAGKECEVDEEAVRLGKEIRKVLAEGAGEKEGLDAYVNYAFGDEGTEAWYGRENWRLEKLRKLKRAWDPEGRFGWYCPIR